MNEYFDLVIWWNLLIIEINLAITTVYHVTFITNCSVIGEWSSSINMLYFTGSRYLATSIAKLHVYTQ